MFPALGSLFRVPVFVFQTGKVGSSSLHDTLAKKLTAPLIHAHQFARLNPDQQRYLTWRRRLHLPIDVVSPVREPIARNISAFFQNFRRDTGMELGGRDWTTAELCDLFLQRYPHNTCLEWFDAHLRPTFGIDVLAEPFPVERKWHLYRAGSVRLLVYRTDLDHGEQLAVVGRFLGVELDRWEYANRSEDKDFAAVYKSFCDTVVLPEVYVKLMYESRFARRFWSEAELAAFARRWRAKPSP